jgi:hypothetical protein
MEVSVDDILTAFADLMSGAKSPEQTAEWAVSVQHNDDLRLLKYVPPRSEVAIWEALEYLSGVDFRDEPDSYLHNNKDHVVALEKFKSGAQR